MGKVVAGIAGVGDLIGAADAGLAFGAAGAGDIAAAGLGAEGLTAAALDPTLTASIAGSAEAGLDAASASFGTFSPELFAANSADVAAGGLGVDAGTAASDLAVGGSGVLGTGADVGAGTFSGLGAPESGVLGAPDSGFFTGTGSDLFSGAGMGPGSGFGTGPVQSFGNVFSGDTLGTQAGTFGTGTTDVAAGAGQSGGLESAAVPGGAAAPTESTPIVQADQGIVNTGGGLPSGPGSGASLQNTINTPSALNPATPNVANASIFQSAQAGGVQDIATQFGDLNPVTTPPASFSDLSGSLATPSIDSAALSSTPLSESGGFVPGTGIEAAPSDFSSSFTPAPNMQLEGASVPTNAFTAGPQTDLTIANVGPSPQMIAGAPEVGPGVSPAATPGVTPAATPGAASPAASPAAATSIGGGVNPLTGLRTATTGLNALTAGIRFANALNQPSFPALMPQAFPGGPFAPDFRNQGGFAGRGGIAGGLAANRLATGLVSGQSAAQLSAQGIISPVRAANLQQTYNGISAQYAQQLGVSPASLSPGVKQLIAARALADNGLGGR